MLTAALLAQTPKTFQDEYDAWFKAHPLPKSDQRSFDKEVAEASAVWVEHWPDEARAWDLRLKYLAKLKSTPDQQLEEVGDTVLRVAKEHPYKGFRFVPFQTDVAEVWTARKIRLERCLELTQEAVLEDKRAESENPSAAKDYRGPIALGFFRTLSLEVGLAEDQKKYNVAESAVAEKKRYLDEHPGLPVDLHYSYLMDAAFLAQIEGHKLDALLYFSEASKLPQDYMSAETHAVQLWKELGGTGEGFNAWKSAIASMDRTPPAANSPSPWTALNKPLTDFRGTDTKGKAWTIADLKGKTTLINIWATWCGPCLRELPSVQALFDQWKDRKDLQLLTVSVDDDFSSAARFAESRHYTFPIVSMRQEELDKMAGFAAVPRTWIVDPSGSVRSELVGFDQALWPKGILQQLGVGR